MFSAIRSGVLNFNRTLSYRPGTDFSLKATVISNLAKTTFATQTAGEGKKKEPMSREDYVKKHMPSFNEYCQKIALPTIKDSGVDAERVAYLSRPEHLQKAYKRYCNGCYDDYVNRITPINPFIL